MSRTSVAFLSLVLLSACVEVSEECLDCDEPSTTISPLVTDTDISSPDPEPSGALSHAADIQPIWDRKCGGCHLDGSDLGDVNLDDAYESLVDISASDLPTMLLVSPGEPEESYLWHKLDDTHRDIGGSGLAMPKNGSLTSAQLDLVFDWIVDGAAP